MIQRLLHPYGERGAIGRKVFFGRLIIIVVLYLILYYACEAVWSGFGDVGVGYLITQSVIEFLFWVVVALLSVARLKDLSWPVGLIVIYMPTWLFGSRNLVIYDLVINNSKGLEGVWLLWLPMMLSITCLGLLVLLTLIPGKLPK